MPSAIILYTRDRRWRVEVEARFINFEFYKSIGTQVVVFRQEQGTNMWGGMETDWDERPALEITIRNVYSGVGPGIATRERSWRNLTHAALTEWSAGGPIHLPTDGLPWSIATAVLDVHTVEGVVSVSIGDEGLSGNVQVSSAVLEPAAAI